MKEAEAKMGMGGFGKKGVTDGGTKIAVKGVASPHGLFTHPAEKNPARVVYALGRVYRAFKTGAGINETSQGAASNLTFKVFGDGKQLWQSKPLRRKGEQQECMLSIVGVDKLELVVECPGKADWAHAVWLEPQVAR